MPLGIDFAQIFLHLFNVVILFAGLYILLYAPVKKFMRKREEYYKDMGKEARREREAAEQLKAEYEEKCKNADLELEEKKKLATAELNQMKARKEAEAREKATSIIENAREEAERQRETIVGEAVGDVSKLVEEASYKLLMEGETGNYYDGFLDRVERSAENGGV